MPRQLPLCLSPASPPHLLEVGFVLLTQAPHVELALTGVTDDDGAVTKRTTQEVRLVAQHTATAQAICVMHHLWRPAGTAYTHTNASGSTTE